MKNKKKQKSPNFGPLVSPNGPRTRFCGGKSLCYYRHMTDLMNGLTEREILFVYEYLKDFNKTNAAIRAGVPSSYANRWATKILREQNVLDAINAAMEVRCKKLKVDANWVLDELIKLYKLDLSEIMKIDPDTGSIRYDFSDVSPEFLQMVEGIEISPQQWGTKIKVNLPSKEKLLEIIGKHVNISAFKELVEHRGSLTLNFDDQDSKA